MAWRVFIDGEAGTTGLQIRERLLRREDIALVSVPEAARKDTEARLKAYAEADVAILCLPDAAVKEIAPEALKLGTRLIDASTAHRSDPEWVYGFPEIAPDRRAALATAQRVSNPGCYSTGALALLAPLVTAGMIAPDQPASIHGVSGYSGGGKALIAEFEEGAGEDYYVYALTQAHKHVPEIMRHGGLTARPVFSPAVGRFRQGMVVQVPLHLDAGAGLADAHGVLANHYAGQQFVTVRESGSFDGRVSATALVGTNRMELSIHGRADSGHAVAIAVLDNLGKGASGAAVQNLNIMLGCAEHVGL